MTCYFLRDRIISNNEMLRERMKLSQTDEGIDLQAQVDDLIRLVDAYRSGAVAEDHQD